MEIFQEILHAYGIIQPAGISEIGSGLINRTWKIVLPDQAFVLQQVNHHVFKEPSAIAQNLQLLNEYANDHWPDYLFPAPVLTTSGEAMVHKKEYGYYRLLPFIKNSHTIDVVETPDQGYQAALQFSAFTRRFAGFGANRLHATIPGFHDLALRFEQFKEALVNGDGTRIKKAENLIHQVYENSWILLDFEKIKKEKIIRERVTHHDTKISNVLFDPQDKGICVIDLDTVMSGYYISDLGDMMRTYLSPASEEVTDFDTIEIRENYFEAVAAGFLENIADVLGEDEKNYLLYSGSFLIYMQALRFLTDYINKDVYYGAKHEDHNYCRAANQFDLLKKFEAKKEVMRNILARILR